MIVAWRGEQDRIRMVEVTKATPCKVSFVIILFLLSALLKVPLLRCHVSARASIKLAPKRALAPVQWEGGDYLPF
mgnify:FL=1